MSWHHYITIRYIRSVSLRFTSIFNRKSNTQLRTVYVHQLNSSNYYFNKSRIEVSIRSGALIDRSIIDIFFSSFFHLYWIVIDQLESSLYCPKHIAVSQLVSQLSFIHSFNSFLLSWTLCSLGPPLWLAMGNGTPEIGVLLRSRKLFALQECRVHDVARMIMKQH